MALAIRLSRGGRRNRPFYRIVVADKRMPRDGRYIEKLGTYNPLLEQDNEKRVQFTKERVEYWLAQGAKPSERVAIFLGKAGIIDMPEQPNRPQKSAMGEKAKLRIEDKEEKRKAAEEAAKQAEEEAKAAAEEAKAAEEAEASADTAATTGEEAQTQEITEDAPSTKEAVEATNEAEEKAEEEKKEA